MIPVDYKTRKFYKKDTEVVDQNSSKRIFLSLENLQ
jgi:hypothetical protein